ncbi:winged helix-turn-helix transcriptional regulator [Amycolatopsis rubida]|uniref:winged helix-turn-helix transcriptional regulator n=1 Tax=Amycolatopsis rubida TaxID=112413 RepID=UPI00142F3AA6|nr:winged helix-turn-helix transcriptional regulator [Amycolatopsis rubida]
MNDWNVSYRRSLHELLTLLSGQWTVAVIATLAVGERSYTELLDEVNKAEEQQGWTSHAKPLSSKVLSSHLRRLEANALIERRAEGIKFNKVWYRLSADGQELLSMLRPLASWSAQRHVIAALEDETTPPS